MKEKTRKIAVYEEEYEQLEAIRNYNKSYPDGYPQLLWYAQQLFDNMLRQPYKRKAPLLRAGHILNIIGYGKGRSYIRHEKSVQRYLNKHLMA